MKRKSQEDVIAKFVSIWGDRFDYSKVNYVNSDTRVVIVCGKHGDFSLTSYQHNSGSGCYKCGRESAAIKTGKKNKQSQVEFIAECKKKHGDRYDYSKTVYEHSSKLITVGCSVHGDFVTKAASHKYGSGCTKCALAERSKAYSMLPGTFWSRVNEKHGSTYEYLCEFTGLDNNISIRCDIHGTFEQKACLHLVTSGCQRCSKERVAKSVTITEEDYLTGCYKIHGDTYSYEKTKYIGCYDRVIITCKVHGDFLQRANVHSHGSGCPKCRHRISKPALAWLTSIGVPVIEQYLPDVKKYADGYDPQTKTVYLFHGDYWHGNPKVYDPEVLNTRTKLKFGDMYQQTLLTEQKYKDYGYNVVVKWEYDWKQENGKNF